MTSVTEIAVESEARIRALPCWRTAVEIEPLEGGITNQNYLVSSAQEKFVVRLGSDILEHQIMRFNEIAAATAAHAAGLSPQIRYHEEGVLVMDFIASEALTAEQTKSDGQFVRIVELVRQCHNTIPEYLRGPSVVFWVFHVIRDYAATLTDGKSRYMSRLPALLKTADKLENAAAPFDIVFGHNDLLPANLLDDGDRLWLIDWEYAGFNTPLFDLGGLASNSEFDESLEHRMLEIYFEKPVNVELWYRYQAMKCASLLRESMWSMVSEIHSTLDFDYAAYTDENLKRLEQSLSHFNGM